MKRVLEDSLSLIAGAGVGMALMYLLDPESGQQRRKKIGSSARQTYESAAEALINAADSARDAASSSSSRLSDYSDSARDRGRRALSRLSAMTSNFSDAASGTAESASDTASSWGDYLGSYGSRLGNRARHMLPSNFSSFGRRQRSSEWTAGPIAGYSAGGLGLVAFGAGLAFLFDPTRGRARRGYLRDQIVSLTNDAANFMTKMGRDVSNRMQGTVAESSAMFRREQPSDRQLTERVRSQLGRISGARNIDVSSTNGSVTLRYVGSQPLTQDVIDAINSTVSGIRGVNNLTCHFPAAATSGAPMM
jgi:gas vesicle protein